MVRSFRERLADRGAEPDVKKIALTYDDIERYSLPSNFTKKSDKRSAQHKAKYGDVSAELDALPPTVLRARIIEAVESHMDMDALAAVRAQEAEDRVWLAEQVEHLRRSRG